MTPAISAVQQAGVRYALHGYEAVERRRWDAARMFKTLVVAVDGELRVACVPVSAQLDLKELGKRAKLADKEQANRSTGYVTGGTSPLGQRKLQLELDPNDLVRLTGARVHPIASAR